MVREITRRRRAYYLSLFWTAGAIGAAALTGMRAWIALTSGQITLPFSFGMLKPMTRGDDPLMFHVALVLTLLVAMGFVYVAYRLWRERDATAVTGAQENRVSTLR